MLKFFKTEKKSIHNRSIFFNYLINFLILRAIKRFFIAFNYFKKNILILIPLEKKVKFIHYFSLTKR